MPPAVPAIQIQIFGTREAAARMGRATAGALEAALQGAMTKALALVERRAKQKLSNDVLHRRTGRLASSIGAPGREGIRKVGHESGGLVGRVGTKVVYAKAHEFGATIDIPEIVPRKRKALRWIGAGGEAIFARRVRAHTVVIPKRPFMAPSLKEEKENILELFRKAIARVLGPEA